MEKEDLEALVDALVKRINFLEEQVRVLKEQIARIKSLP